MNKRNRVLRIALLLSLVGVIAFAVPLTLAYVTVQTPTMINTFAAPELEAGAAMVNVYVEKTIIAAGESQMSPAGFLFMLRDELTGQEYVMTTDAQGRAQARLVFSEKDVGRTYFFTIAEINDGRENVEYSEQVYELQVFLGLDQAKRLMPVVTLDGEKVNRVVASFENIDTTPTIAPLPPTGDSMNVLLCLLVLLGCGAGLMLLIRAQRRNTI